MKFRPVKSTSEERAGVCFAIFMLFAGSLLMNYWAWDDIRGSYFLEDDSLGVTLGTIMSSTITTGSYKNPMLGYEIKYKFSIRNKTYISNKITFKNVGTIDPSFARFYVNKYPVGKSVTVYYDPNNPFFSVLEPKEKGNYIGIIVTPFIFAGLFILSLWYYYKKRSSN